MDRSRLNSAGLRAPVARVQWRSIAEGLHKVYAVWKGRFVQQELLRLMRLFNMGVAVMQGVERGRSP